MGKRNMSPLYLAVSTRNIQAAKMLLDAGADINDTFYGIPLTQAASFDADMRRLVKLEFLKQEMEYGDFGEFVSIDDNDLKKALGLERDGDGNIYDPLAKDLDNDGVPDRYDNDFRDSDYFETTYDVEDNLNTKAESKDKVSEKASILGQIRSY